MEEEHDKAEPTEVTDANAAGRFLFGVLLLTNFCRHAAAAPTAAAARRAITPQGCCAPARGSPTRTRHDVGHDVMIGLVRRYRWGLALPRRSCRLPPLPPTTPAFDVQM